MFPCVTLRPVALHAAGDTGDAGEKHPLPAHPNRFGQAHVQVPIVSRCCPRPTRRSQLSTRGDGRWGAEQDRGAPLGWIRLNWINKTSTGIRGRV